MPLIRQDLMEALVTPEAVSWARSEPTQRYLLGPLNRLLGTAQDAWLAGDFQSSRELGIAEQASAHTIAQIIDVYENAVVPEKPETKLSLLEIAKGAVSGY